MKAKRTPKAAFFCNRPESASPRLSLLGSLGFETELHTELPIAESFAALYSTTDLILFDVQTSDVESVIAVLPKGPLSGESSRPSVAFLVNGYAPRLSASESSDGIDAFYADSTAGEILGANFTSLARAKFRRDELAEEVASLKRQVRRLELAHDQIDEELELASRIQKSFLPHALPCIKGLKFAVKTVSTGCVSGDFYDVLPLDGHTVAFYVADAMGHGVPASLLTMYVKKGVVPKDPDRVDHSILAPDQVLQRINDDMLAQEIFENAFVTLTYLTVNCATSELQFARAGHPHPVYIPAKGSIEKLEATGTMLGVFDTSFTRGSRTLSRGDKVLAFTDGVDSVRYRDEKQGLPSFLKFLSDFRVLPIDRLIDEAYNTLFKNESPEDDLTLLGLEYEG